MLDTRLASLTSTKANILLLNILKQCDKSRHSKNDFLSSARFSTQVFVERLKIFLSAHKNNLRVKLFISYNLLIEYKLIYASTLLLKL